MIARGSGGPGVEGGDGGGNTAAGMRTMRAGTSRVVVRAQYAAAGHDRPTTLMDGLCERIIGVESCAATAGRRCSVLNGQLSHCSLGDSRRAPTATGGGAASRTITVLLSLSAAILALALRPPARTAYLLQLGPNREVLRARRCKVSRSGALEDKRQRARLAILILVRRRCCCC